MNNWVEGLTLFFNSCVALIKLFNHSETQFLKRQHGNNEWSWRLSLDDEKDWSLPFDNDVIQCLEMFSFLCTSTLHIF